MALFFFKYMFLIIHIFLHTYTDIHIKYKKKNPIYIILIAISHLKREKIKSLVMKVTQVQRAQMTKEKIAYQILKDHVVNR